MKNLSKPIFTLLFLCFTAPAFAQPVKTFTLHDGTVIKGQLISVVDGVYTVKTTQFGEIRIPDTDVVKIESPEVSAALSAPSMDKAAFQAELQQAQMQILSDPQVMEEIQKLMEDESIRKALSDPQFMNAVMSQDPETIQENKNTDELMQNPRMKALMEKIKDRISEQSPSGQKIPVH